MDDKEITADDFGGKPNINITTRRVEGKKINLALNPADQYLPNCTSFTYRIKPLEPGDKDKIIGNLNATLDTIYMTSGLPSNREFDFDNNTISFTIEKLIDGHKLHEIQESLEIALLGYLVPEDPKELLAPNGRVGHVEEVIRPKLSQLTKPGHN